MIEPLPDIKFDNPEELAKGLTLWGKKLNKLIAVVNSHEMKVHCLLKDYGAFAPDTPKTIQDVTYEDVILATSDTPKCEHKWIMKPSSLHGSCSLCGEEKK